MIKQVGDNYFLDHVSYNNSDNIVCLNNKTERKLNFVELFPNNWHLSIKVTVKNISFQTYLLLMYMIHRKIMEDKQ